MCLNRVECVWMPKSLCRTALFVSWQTTLHHSLCWDIFWSRPCQMLLSGCGYVRSSFGVNLNNFPHYNGNCFYYFWQQVFLLKVSEMCPLCIFFQTNNPIIVTYSFPSSFIQSETWINNWRSSPNPRLLLFLIFSVQQNNYSPPTSPCLPCPIILDDLFDNYIITCGLWDNETWNFWEWIRPLFFFFFATKTCFSC
jgi:hypothetical protein